MAAIKPESNGDILTIHINEPRLLDELTIQELYRDLLSVVEKTQEPKVLLNFAHVNFMSSSALGMLIRINKKCKEYKIALKLSNISPNIREVFKITGLERVFEIYKDAEDAIADFKKGQLFGRKG
jgi:anti-sigma B factor antagonist